MASVQVICVLFISTFPAKQISMVAAIPECMNIRVIFAKNLEIILSLCDLTFDNIIYFDRNRLISVKRTIVFGMASSAFELSFLCESLLCVLFVLNHFSSNTLSACSVSATEHDNGLSRLQVEPVLAIEAIQLY